MFLDTSFNSVAVVMSNLYQSFLDAAERGYEYLKNMPASKRPVSRLLISKLLSPTLGWIDCAYSTWMSSRAGCKSSIASHVDPLLTVAAPLVETLDNLISLAFVLMRNYSRRKQDCRGYQCAVTRRQVKW